MMFAKRINKIEPFRVVEVLARARELEAAGRDIVHMEAGEPDFATAQPIVDAGRQALLKGATYYSQAQGLPELKIAIADYYLSDYGLRIAPERILLTPGASGALQLLSALLIDPGDGVLMADPGYPCNRNFIRLMGGEEQLVPVGVAERYQLTAAKAEAYWQNNTRGLMLASPSNPTGSIVHAEELLALAKLCQRKAGYLIVDEIYQGLCCDVQPSSILSISDAAYVVNSFSKYFGMTGWRLGWMVVPDAAVEPLHRLAQNIFISMSTMAQFAALAAFTPETRAILDERKAIFAERRNYLLTALTSLGLAVPYVPDGAFYVYLCVEDYTQDSKQFCLDALETHGVAMTPGLDFGSHQANTHIRLAYTTSMQQLEKGVERLAKIFVR